MERVTLRSPHGYQFTVGVEFITEKALRQWFGSRDPMLLVDAESLVAFAEDAEGFRGLPPRRTYVAVRERAVQDSDTEGEEDRPSRQLDVGRYRKTLVALQDLVTRRYKPLSPAAYQFSETFLDPAFRACCRSTSASDVRARLECVSPHGLFRLPVFSPAFCRCVANFFSVWPRPTTCRPQ